MPEMQTGQGEVQQGVTSLLKISSIETGQFSPTAKLVLILCIALDRRFEEVFFF